MKRDRMKEIRETEEKKKYTRWDERGYVIECCVRLPRFANIFAGAN